MTDIDIETRLRSDEPAEAADLWLLNLEAADAIARLRAATAWQPIETAPRDGTEILVWFDFATVEIVHIARWVEPEEWSPPTADDEAGWWSYTENSVGQTMLTGDFAPTHWKPLGPPPEGESHG